MGIFAARRRVDGPGHRAVLLAPLIPSTLDDGNRRVAERFGHTRLKFVSMDRKSDVEVEVIDERNIVGYVTVVIDPMWASNQYTRNFRINDINSTAEVRKGIRFFKLKDHMVT